MSFQFIPLPASQFSHLHGLSENALKDQCVEIHVSDGGYPCRVSLEDVPAGKPVFLLNYEHQSATTPYRSRHAIFVGCNAIEASTPENTIPEMIASRLLSVRGFNASGSMMDAEVVDGADLKSEIKRQFANSEIDYLHIHFARRGCYAARVERVVSL